MNPTTLRRRMAKLEAAGAGDQPRELRFEMDLGDGRAPRVALWRLAPWAKLVPRLFSFVLDKPPAAPAERDRA